MIQMYKPKEIRAFPCGEEQVTTRDMMSEGRRRLWASTRGQSFPAFVTFS
jgi:hypothetical protein